MLEDRKGKRGFLEDLLLNARFSKKKTATKRSQIANNRKEKLHILSLNRICLGNKKRLFFK